jgi:UDP-N-acetyl-D-glucosamine dehydrogenase
VPSLSARAWHGGLELKSDALTSAALADADCVVILTDHKAVDYAMVVESATLIVDTRNAIPGSHAHVFKLGAPTAALVPATEEAAA